MKCGNTSGKSGYVKTLSGLFPSITTPFTGAKIDYGRLRFNIERYNEFDLGGYMILGGNGEYLGLTPNETIKSAKTIISARKQGRPVVAGAGRESAEATLKFIRSIADIGADIASIITPFYYAKRMGDKNLIAYYSAIADESPIPILIYNSPSYAAGVEISPYALSELSRHENIAGMKNSSGRELSDYKAAVSRTSFGFHSGSVPCLYRDLKQGADGATLSAADYWPEELISVCRLMKLGRDAEALKLCEAVEHAGRAGAFDYGVAGVKYAMDLAGFYGGEPRLPLLPLSDEQKARVEKSFALRGESIIT